MRAGTRVFAESPACAMKGRVMLAALGDDSSHQADKLGAVTRLQQTHQISSQVSRLVTIILIWQQYPGYHRHDSTLWVPRYLLTGAE